VEAAVPVPVHARDVPALVRVADAKPGLTMGWFQTARRLKKVSLPPQVGMHHFQHVDGEEKDRFHLRIEDDGSGFLLLNANQLFFLNQTAVVMAYLKLHQLTDDQILKKLLATYETDKTQMEADLNEFSRILDSLLHDRDKCPFHDLHLETIAAKSTLPQAPYRMDLAITYHCNNNCSHCYNARARNHPELTTEEWKKILNQLWELGIPHIIFTGGEPTLRKDLPELIAYAESLGQITGINTNGRNLKEPAYVQKLVEAGLDHVQITIESNEPAIHDQMQGVEGAWQDTVMGIKNVVASSLYLMTNTTMLTLNKETIPATIDFLAEIGVPTIGLNSLIHAGKGKENQNGLSHEEINTLLEVAKEKTAQTGQRLIWYTPTQYCHFNPILHGVGAKGCSAAKYNMCIEPNGDVIPCQSYYAALGNIQTSAWKEIWHHPLCEAIRNHNLIPDACHQCNLLDECGGGCPLAYIDQAYPEPIPFVDLIPEEMELLCDEIPE
jgi:radical SAM protein with 4Fe4S-binding SPASM domain